METVIKRASKGEKVRSEELSITGRVIEIIGYNEAFANKRLDETLFLNRNLLKELGDGFRNKYFECFIKTIYAKQNSEYRKGEIVVINWKDYQKCTTLYY